MNGLRREAHLVLDRDDLGFHRSEETSVSDVHMSRRIREGFGVQFHNLFFDALPFRIKQVNVDIRKRWSHNDLSSVCQASGLVERVTPKKRAALFFVPPGGPGDRTR